MRTSRNVLGLAMLMGIVPVSARGPIDREPVLAGVRVFYGPQRGFDEVDTELIARARRHLDMTAYVLTDRHVIEALAAAAGRGVRIRLYLDPEQPGGQSATGARLGDLLRSNMVEARIKARGGDFMHLKAYQVDGRFLRSGSANFSFSGETRQDNDIVVLESRDAAAAFIGQFEQLWARPGNVRFVH